MSAISRVRITYYGETVEMTWDGSQASAPIRVDGECTGFQTANARHWTQEAVRLVAGYVWPEVRDWSDGSEAWDDLAFDTLEDETEECSAVAAIGSDGTRLVVWGLGDDEETAMEDAAPYSHDAHPMPRLRCVDVDDGQRARIVAGEIDCADLGIT